MESNWLDSPGGRLVLGSDLPQPFGPYTLLRRLAVGGMAEVYVARAQGGGGFEKLVALKRIHPRHSTDEGFVSMLIDEAKLSVGLTHQNIVQTFDLGCIDDAYFIVMEHVEGWDAHHVLQALRRNGRKLPVDLAVHIVMEVCRGLDYAHRRADATGRPLNIVHRDVSPQNVLLSFAGEVKITDFGIAKTASRASDPEAGIIKGKYFYMSPEQAWGDPVDHRSDIFSAGIVLWELLVGETLHNASHVKLLLDAVRRAEVPPPSALRKDVPVELDAMVARATARDRNERYQDARVFADALCTYLAARPPLHASRQIRDMLIEIDAPEPATVYGPVEDVPRTRDHVVTRPLEELPTPSSAPLRFDLEDGEPTITGWRSPHVPNTLRWWWWWAVGVGALAGAAALWILAA